MKPLKPTNFLENFKQFNPPNYQTYKKTASSTLPPISKENKKLF